MSADFSRASCQLIPPDSSSNSCALLSSRIIAVTSCFLQSCAIILRDLKYRTMLCPCRQIKTDRSEIATLLPESPFVISGTSGRGTWISFCSFDLFKLGVEYFPSAQFLQPCSPTRLTRITSFNTMTCRFTVAIENWPINLVGHSNAITTFGML